MKYCQKHWDQLKDSIKKYGIWSMVSSDAIEALRRQQATTQTKENFDPLMACSIQVYQRALRLLGFYMLNEVEICPVCELIEKIPDSKGRTKEELELHYSDELVASCHEFCVSQGWVKSN